MDNTTDATRQDRKRRTRRALLDAALDLLADRGLSGVGLREVTRAVGIAPAAFYRHFPAMEDLGVALVTESFGGLRAAMREVRANGPEPEQIVGRSLDILARHVRDNPTLMRFIARERHSGVPAVRTAIQAEVRQFIDELAADIAPLPFLADWPASDVHVLAALVVNVMVTTAAALLDARDAAITPTSATVPPTTGAPVLTEAEVLAAAHRQLDLIVTGARHWFPT